MVYNNITISTRTNYNESGFINMAALEKACLNLHVSK